MDKDCSGRVSHWEFQAAIQVGLRAITDPVPMRPKSSPASGAPSPHSGRARDAYHQQKRIVHHGMFHLSRRCRLLKIVSRPWQREGRGSSCCWASASFLGPVRSSVPSRRFPAMSQNIRSGENQESVFSNTKIQQMLNSLDTNGDGIMDYQEFLAAVLLNHQMEQDAEWERNARRAFDVLDADGNGVLTVNELQVPLKMSSSEVMLMVKEIDNNFDGRIDMDEFKHVSRRRCIVALDFRSRAT